MRSAVVNFFGGATFQRASRFTPTVPLPVIVCGLAVASWRWRRRSATRPGRAASHSPTLCWFVARRRSRMSTAMRRNPAASNPMPTYRTVSAAVVTTGNVSGARC